MVQVSAIREFEVEGYEPWSKFLQGGSIGKKYRGY